MALKTSLVAYWNLDEASGNRADSAGGGYTLTAAGSAGSETVSPHGQVALLASASSQYLYRADTAALDITGDMTVNAFVNFTSLTAPTSNTHAIISKWNHSAQNQYLFTVNTSSSQLNSITDDNCSGFTYTTTSRTVTTLAIDTWYMVTWTRTGTTMETYFNGVSQGTDATQTSASCTAEFAIGIEKGRDLYKANMRVCKAGMWSRALSAAERTELYNSGNGLLYSELDAVVATQRISPSGGVAYSGGVTLY